MQSYFYFYYYIKFFYCSYNGIEHSNPNLTKHSKMTTNNVSSVMNFEQKLLPGLKTHEKKIFIFIFY